MPYSDNTQFPRGLFSTTALTNVAQAVSPAGEATKVVWGVATGGAADEIIIFRKSGAGAEHFRLPVPAGVSVRIDGFHAEGGLEVLTASAAGDVGLVIARFVA